MGWPKPPPNSTPANAKQFMRFCSHCQHRTPHNLLFTELEVEYLACSECGTITHLHPA
jgi:hypothetical protein